MIEIGRKIRQHRRRLGLTQEELAQRTELTKGYISQLENDLCSPSIATLEDILNVLGVSLQEFFAEPKPQQVVYTPNDYFVSENDSGSITWLITDSQVRQMEPIILTLKPGCQSAERAPFEGEEFGYVLQGTILLTLGGETHTLAKGDSFYLNGTRQHSIKNIGKGESKVLWATTPSNF